MFIDFREFPKDELIETDICVIGAGAAGLAITQALADSSMDVCLLETGGMSPELAYMQLAEPALSQGDYLTTGCRARQFGGSTTHWGGVSIPLDDIDFQARDWVAHSGWPISRADIEPWYEQANGIVKAGAYQYTKAQLEVADWPYPEFNLEFFDDIYFRRAYQATEFNKLYKQSLEDAANVRVFLHATVTELHADPTSKTTQYATIKEPAGNAARIKARYFVIAAGSLESSRLLLASNDVQPEGLGNQTDQVGRYFMMHPHLDIGRIEGINPELLAFFDFNPQGGADFKAGIRPRPSVQQEQRILNTSVRFEGIPDTQTGYYAFREIVHELGDYYKDWKADASPELPDNFDELVWMALKDLDSVYGGLMERRSNPKFQGNLLQTQASIYVQSEQAPNPASRITLAAEKDSLGVPMMVQDCQVLPIDKHTLRVTGELLGRDLAMRGDGRVKIADWLLDDSLKWDVEMWGGCHHMGTTRMTATDVDGVVDVNCKLHSVDNTFVASGSVFTTGGYANPTITVVALALRLADHLKSLG
jgi:choline dehydrogenase-like flavoprotein